MRYINCLLLVSIHLSCFIFFFWTAIVNALKLCWTLFSNLNNAVFKTNKKDITPFLIWQSYGTCLTRKIKQVTLVVLNCLLAWVRHETVKLSNSTRANHFLFKQNSFILFLQVPDAPIARRHRHRRQQVRTCRLLNVCVCPSQKCRLWCQRRSPYPPSHRLAVDRAVRRTSQNHHQPEVCISQERNKNGSG